MSRRYRVTIPPFEVDASDMFEAESIVDDLIGNGAYDYEIEDITEPLRCRHCGAAPLTPVDGLPGLWDDSKGRCVCIPLVMASTGNFQIHQPESEAP